MRHVMLLLESAPHLIMRAPPKGPLVTAAVTNNADAIRGLLADGHPPDESGGDSLTPLTWAARSGAIQALTALLDAGADVNARDNNRWTPLLHAIRKRGRARFARAAPSCQRRRQRRRARRRHAAVHGSRQYRPVRCKRCWNTVPTRAPRPWRHDGVDPSRVRRRDD